MNKIELVSRKGKKFKVCVKHIQYIGINEDDGYKIFGLFMKADRFFEIHEIDNDVETVKVLTELYESL